MAPLPPPLTEAGAIGWMRKNLFSSPLNIALTILVALLIVWIVPPLVKFLVIDAVWNGAEPRRLPGAVGSHPRVGACWAFVSNDRPYFIYGFYPIDGALAGRRVLRAAGVGVVWMAWLDAPRRDLGVVYFFVVMPIASLILLLGWPLLGLPSGRHTCCGAACW